MQKLYCTNWVINNVYMYDCTNYVMRDYVYNVVYQTLLRRLSKIYLHFDFGSRPRDHYFRGVCLFVCAEFFSAVFDPISIKLGHMLYVWV